MLLHRKDSGVPFNPEGWTLADPGEGMRLVDTALEQGNRVANLEPKDGPFLGYAISRTVNGATSREFYVLYLDEKPELTFRVVKIRERMGSGRGG